MIQWYEFKTIITRLSEFPPFSRSFSRRKSQSSRRSSIIRGKNSCVHRASTTFRREIFVFHRRATSLINSTRSPFSDSLKSRVHGRNPFSLSIHKGQPGSLSPLGCHFYVHVFPFIRVTWTRHLYVLDSRLLAADRWTPPAVEKKKRNDRGQKLGIRPSQRPPRNNAMEEIDFRIWVVMGLIRVWIRISRSITKTNLCFLPIYSLTLINQYYDYKYIHNYCLIELDFVILMSSNTSRASIWSKRGQINIILRYINFLSLL